MSEHDPSHPQWEVPPAAPAGSGAVPSQMAPAARPHSRWRRGSHRPARGRARGLLVAAVASALLIGGGVSGVAFADDGGPGGGPGPAGFTSSDVARHADTAVDTFDGAHAARRG